MCHFQVSQAVKSTEERLGQLGTGSAAGELKDDEQVQTYLAQAGPQGMQLSASQRQQLAQQEAERKRAKAEKKMKKLEKGFGGLGAAIGGMVGTAKRAGSPPADPKREVDLEKAAAELAKKIAAQHGFKLEAQEEEEEETEKKEKRKENEEKKEDEKMKEEDEKMKEEDEDKKKEDEKMKEEDEDKKKEEEKMKEEAKPTVEIAQMEETPTAPARNWAAFDNASLLPPSQSEMELTQKLCATTVDPFDTTKANATLEGESEADPFAPQPKEMADPFEVGINVER
jgi:hypothetical protein